MRCVRVSSFVVYNRKCSKQSLVLLTRNAQQRYISGINKNPSIGHHHACIEKALESISSFVAFACETWTLSLYGIATTTKNMRIRISFFVRNKQKRIKYNCTSFTSKEIYDCWSVKKDDSDSPFGKFLLSKVGTARDQPTLLSVL